MALEERRADLRLECAYAIGDVRLDSVELAGSAGDTAAACNCRKPAPGMIEQACREMDLDPLRSVMVGDRWTDVVCGRAAGTRTVLLRAEDGVSEAHAVPPDGVRADAILTNLMEAAGWILRTMA